jgi:hypothetical protein
VLPFPCAFRLFSRRAGVPNGRDSRERSSTPFDSWQIRKVWAASFCVFLSCAVLEVQMGREGKVINDVRAGGQRRRRKSSGSSCIFRVIRNAARVILPQNSAGVEIDKGKNSQQYFYFSGAWYLKPEKAKKKKHFVIIIFISTQNSFLSLSTSNPLFPLY